MHGSHLRHWYGEKKFVTYTIDGPKRRVESVCEGIDGGPFHTQKW